MHDSRSDGGAINETRAMSQQKLQKLKKETKDLIYKFS